MKRWMPDLRSLSVQMILISVAMVLLTATAAGLPAIWLIHDQLHDQAWAQVEQGSIAAQALYAAKQSELSALATLTAQRPTLRDLLAQADQGALLIYLRTLQQASGLDLVLVCSADQRPIARAGEPIPDDLCAEVDRPGIHVAIQETLSPAWLLASESLDDEGTDSPGRVIVGLVVDDQFAKEMRAQTGLDHTVLVGGQTVATDLAGRRQVPSTHWDDKARGTFDLDGRSYYAVRVPVAGAGPPAAADTARVEAEVALDVSDIDATQRNLAWTLIGSIVAVAAVASLLGAVLARRIAQPLARLAQAASTITEGDLDESLIVEARVREVTLVAQALEGARADLQRTLAELRQEKAWTDHLLEAIVEGIVTLDRHGHITYFSHGAERITGWKRDAVIGLTCDHVFRAAETVEPFSQLIPAPGQRRKIPVRMREGRQAILAVTGAQLVPPEGSAARVALVFRDISEEEAVHRLLGHFLANVAHEFRTPLSALAASVELLLDQAPDLSAGELQELLVSLHLGVLGLQTLVDNLLESASIETGHFRVHPRPSNLGEIIAEAVAMMQPLLDKHGQRLVIELPAAIPVVQTDPRRTVQVLINLLSNASKYGPDDSEIRVSAGEQGHWVRVSVADSGPGVPAEHRKDLFRRFVHPSINNDKAQVGVGLGLSVVKAVVEAHGGQVGIEDHPGSGSIFWFTLPRVKES
jgi:PAS domain S-box-containing protein